MDLLQTVAPTEEPLTVAEAKYHLRIDTPDLTADIASLENTYIGSLIAAARGHCEQETGRQFCTATWQLKLPFFPRAGCNNWQLYGVSQAAYLGPEDWRSIYLPRPKLASVTSVTYYDADNASQTFSSGSYTVIVGDPVGRIALNYAEVWPVTRPRQDAVTVTYVSGTAASSVPDGVKHAMRLLIGHWYEHREQVTLGMIPSSLPMGVEALLNPYRVWEYA